VAVCRSEHHPRQPSRGDDDDLDQRRHDPVHRRAGHAVYVFAVYDQTGGYDGRSGPPPRGVPKAIYTRTARGAPAPVKGGQAISFTFTDAERWK
jgi:hypothetical protein